MVSPVPAEAHIFTRFLLLLFGKCSTVEMVT
ncbi:hypothetical protein L608_000400002040 [Bacillus subtilis J23]|nr:hypothetical protein L608_000400002040 [Bacillus subtilis J23]